MAKTIPIAKAVELALEQHQAGNLTRAEVLYVEILRQDPGNVDAMHLLGVLANQGQQPATAVELISRAIARRSDVAIFHYNLADALVTLNRLPEAIASYRRSIELDASYVQAHVNLSNALNRTGDFIQAETAARKALVIAPSAVSGLNNLGVALHGLNQCEEAVKIYRQALDLENENADVLINLAKCLSAMSLPEEAIEYYRKAVQFRPASVDLHNDLGVALVYLKRLEEAAASFQTALELKPDHVEALINLGAMLRSTGKHVEAIRFFEKAMASRPTFVDAHASLAAALSDLNRQAEALPHIERAVELSPTSSQLHQLHGLVLRDVGRIDDSVAAIRRSLQLRPDDGQALTALGYALLEYGDLDAAMKTLLHSVQHSPQPHVHSNMLMAANYHPDFSAADLLSLHRRWSELHEQPLIAGRQPHTNDRTPTRKLRIAYVSPDFRGHSVAYFLEPILAHHDHSKFEVFGYAQVANFDSNTYWLRTHVDHWRETLGKSAEEIEKMIRDDQIDILIDLAGHTGGNLLPMFARKPAPVQINMIGFPSTTGLSAMDYRITDACCDPPGLTDEFNTETLIRMPNTFWVYRPPSEAIDIGELPATRTGAFTFTSVNNLTKVTPHVQVIWARLLREVPDARLIVQTGATNSERARQNIRERFEAQGVSADRLEFKPFSNLADYLALLEASDITLDPFPFNGGTTTCHSLWMGAPVITLAGDRHASRMGLSILTHVGLSEFIAKDPDDYIAIGREMARDRTYLSQVRAQLRRRLNASPLMNETEYVLELEAVYRRAWATWCQMPAFPK